MHIHILLQAQPRESYLMAYERTLDNPCICSNVRNSKSCQFQNKLNKRNRSCRIPPGVLYSPGTRGPLRNRLICAFDGATVGLKYINHHLHCLSHLCAQLCFALRPNRQICRMLHCNRHWPAIFHIPDLVMLKIVPCPAKVDRQKEEL